MRMAEINRVGKAMPNSNSQRDEDEQESSISVRTGVYHDTAEAPNGIGEPQPEGEVMNEQPSDRFALQLKGTDSLIWRKTS